MKFYPRDIASLIEIRNFLYASVDNLSIRLSREEIKSVQSKVAYLDKSIISASLTLDLSEIDMEVKLALTDGPSKEMTRESTEDIKNVSLETLDKLSEPAKTSTEKPTKKSAKGFIKFGDDKDETK